MAGDKIAEATDAAGKKLEQSRDAAAQQKPSGPGKADAALTCMSLIGELG